jgi:hypothetical protein
MSKTVRILVWLGCSLWLSIGTCWGGESPQGIGLNKYELFLQYLGQASGGDGSPPYREVTRAMAKKALWDARNVGVSYLRVSVMGYFPVAYSQKGNLDLWRADTTAYWHAMDQMMADLDAEGIRLIPVFVWNKVQLPAMEGETIADLLKDANSKSYQLLVKYVTEFIARYRSRQTVLFYELTNELNLGADLDGVGRCLKELPPKRCAPLANYSTEQMIAFTSRFAALIRRLDPTKPISSGFAVPRPAAESLRRNPEWVTGRADWTADNKSSLEKNLLDIHRDMDIVSVHLYPSLNKPRFGKDEVFLLRQLKEIADKAGKTLFVGEFGGPNGEGIGSDSFMDRMIDQIVALDVPYSAAWGWEFYQKSPYATRDTQATMFALEPGYSDRINSVLSAANYRLGKHAPSSNTKDEIPPEVVLTWPLPCQSIAGKQLVHASASDDRGKVRRVEFSLDDKNKFVDSEAPYQWELDTKGFQPGEYALQVRAVDEVGNASSMVRSIFVGRPAMAAACRATFGEALRR